MEPPIDPTQMFDGGGGALPPGMGDPTGGGGMPGMEGIPPELLPQMPLEEDDTPEVDPAALQPDSLSMFRNLKLEHGKLTELGRRIGEEVSAYTEAVRDRVDNAREWRESYRMYPDSGAGPYRGSAKLRSAETRRVCQAHTTRLDQQITQQERPFAAVPEDETAIQAVSVIEEALGAKLEEADWRVSVRQLARELPVVCPTLMRCTWDVHRWRRPKTEVEVDEQAMSDLMAAGASMAEAMAGAAKTSADGKLKTYWEWEEMEDQALELRVIPFEDAVLLPAGATREKDLWGIGERLRLRGMDLKRGAKEGRYLEDAVETLLARQSSELTEPHQDRQELSGVITSGGSGLSDDTRTLYREYDCVELCWYDDLDDDGEMEWYIATVALDADLVIRVQYSPYWHGRAYYKAFGYVQYAGEIMGESIAEMVAVPQDACTAALNAFANLLDIEVAKVTSLLYTSQSGFDPDNFELAMLSSVEVIDVEGIKPYPGLPQAVAPVLSAILEFLQFSKDQNDQLTAVSNPGIGVATDAKKTAYEVGVVQGNANEIFEGYAMGVALDLCEVWDMARHTLAQFGAKGGSIPYRVAGEGGPEVPPEFREISSEAMRAKVRLVPTGINAFPDRQAMLQRDMMLLQTLGQDPLTGGDMSLRAELLKTVVRDLNPPERRRIEAAIDQAVQAAMQQQMMMQQQQQQQAMQAAQGDPRMAQQEQQGQMQQQQMAMQQSQAGGAERRADEMHTAKLAQLGHGMSLAERAAAGNGKTARK